MAPRQRQAPNDGLSKRSAEILRLLADGMSDREIAERLVMTVNTVKWYNRQIYSILDVGSRTQAIARARELQLLDEGEDAAPSLPASGRALKHNLPIETTRFIKRQQELEEILRLLDSAHLLTLVGPPGTGKTRLALQAGSEAADSFGEEVYFVSLAPISDPALVTNSIAVAVGVNEAQGRPLIETLKLVLRESRMLLILDNFEHLLPAATQVSELLAAAPHLKVLATSREPLHLYGEQEYAVPPLKLPDPRQHDPLTLLDCESVALFMQQARAVRPDFALTTENVTDVINICVRLEGLPLAIELAAARVKLLTPQTLLLRLNSRLDTLTGGAQDLPARQQTLHNTIEWSYNLLNEGEKILFARLAIFRGGLSLEAVETVCGPDLPMEVYDGLESLVNKSLIQQQELPSGEPRFVMLETLHEYAWERLQETKTAYIAIAGRHSAYYLDLVSRYEAAFYGENPLEAMAVIRRELDNVRQAWRWAAERGPISILREAIDGLAAFYEATSLFEEAPMVFAHAAEQVEGWQREERVLETGENEQSANVEVVEETVCHLLARVAEFTELRGAIEESYAVAEKVIELADRLKLPRYRADALRTLGILGRGTGASKQAIEHLREAIAIYRSLDAKRPLAVTYDWLALVNSDMRNLNEALVYLQEAATLYADIKYERGIVFNKGMTAIVFSVLGRLEESLAYQREVLTRYQKLDYPLGTARTANNIGFDLLELGEIEEALAQLEHANRIARQIGSLSLAHISLGNMGEAHLALDEYDKARDCLERAGQYYREVGMRWLESENLWRIGWLLVNTGEYAQAQTALNECLALATEKEDPESFVIAHGLLGTIAWRLGHGDEAMTHFYLASAAFEAIRRHLTVARFVLMPHATLLLEQGKIAAAERALTEMRPLLKGDTGRNPVFVESRLLHARISFAQEDREGGRRTLENLVNGRWRPVEKAAVHYEWWLLEDDESHGRQALALYQQLASRSPNITYHNRLATLQAAGFH